MSEDVFEALGRVGLVPVISLQRADDAVPLAQALSQGQLPVAEITFRTPAAGESLRRMARDCPHMMLGAGTVLTLRQAEQAQAAGATYIVSPGFDPAVVDWCLRQDMPILPGVATPSEILLALGRNLRSLKFFPAQELGGTRMLKALRGPFAEVRFVPTGGITAENMAEYLALPNVIAVGGSWMAPNSLIAAGRFAEITALAAAAVQAARAARAQPASSV
jgi:2-dehydro-3-deoxyphosphogluconate aldolase/(4S)-4-hydroxy-2-oxoglutarate aldolase